MRARRHLALLLILAGCDPRAAKDEVAAAVAALETPPEPGGRRRNAWRVERDAPDREAAAALRKIAGAKGFVRVLARLDVPFTPEGELEKPARIAAQHAAIARAGAALVERLPPEGTWVKARYASIPWVALEVTADSFDRLLADPSVVAIEEDVAVPPALAQSVPMIDGVGAWEAGGSGTGQYVAVLDTGVASNHPFLAGKIASEACYSTNDNPLNPFTPATTAFCSPGSTSAGAGADCPSSVPGCGHGTHVAGIAAGTNASFSGVAKDARLVAIQVFTQFDDDSDCSNGAPCALSLTSDQILGLERVLTLVNGGLPIASVNMSLGGGRYTSNCDSDSRKSVIDNLKSRRVATIIASGNESFTDAVSAPGCISSAITVGSVTKSDVVASYSNGATLVDLLAPGSSINSSVLGDGYGIKSGTSMATPHVAGAFAALRSRVPLATVDSLAGALASTGLPIRDTRNNLTFPRIRLGPALESLLVARPVPNPPAGHFESPIPVTITSATPGAQLRFTLDGTTPTADVGTLLASGGSLTIDQDRTLKVVAFVPGMPESRVVTGAFNLLGGVRTNLAPGGALPVSARWRLGSVTESFERGTFAELPWVSSWVIGEDSARTGRYAARAPSVPDDGSASMSVQVETAAGSVRFALRVSSEKDYDYLRFYVDGVLRARWSGEVAWTEFTENVTAGAHTFTWTYTKDVSDSGGADTAWVDAITIPGDAWRANGSRAPLVPPGTNTVVFSPAFGWIAPLPRTISVLSTQTTVVDAEYVPAVGVPTFQPAPGLFTAPVAVQISSNSGDALIRYTTDGTTPSRTNGVEIPSGSSVTLAATARLRAIAFTPSGPDSAETSGTYEVSGASLRVTLAPEAAVTAGAAWRGRGFVEHFETGQFNRLPWSATGWLVAQDTTPNGTNSARAALLPANGTASLGVTIESDGGLVRFLRRVQSQQGSDFLEFRVDGVLLGRWSGELPWEEVSYAVAAGTRLLEWRYVKDASGSSGADTAWIDGLVLPGDAWRTAPTTLTQLPAGPLAATFRAAPGWATPADRALPLTNGETTDALVTWDRLQVATPSISPNGGSFTSPVQVTLATATPDATLRYTLDGTPPTASSTLYTAPFVLLADTRTELRVQAFRAPWLESAVASASFVVTGTVFPPLFDPPSGVVGVSRGVTLRTLSPDAVIRYTLDGTDPTDASPAFTTPVPLIDFSTVRIRARAYRAGWVPSPLVEGIWHVNGQVARPTVTPPPGSYTSPQSVVLATDTLDAEVRYTIDGTEPSRTSPLFTEPFLVPRFTDVLFRARAFRAGWLESERLDASFRVTGAASVPVFTPAPGLFTTAQAVTISSATAGATVRYTLDGSPVTGSSPVVTGPLVLDLDSTTVVRARASRADWEDSTEVTGTFRITGVVPAPTLSPEPGLFQTAQTITLASAVPGAEIHYTLDGSAPTAQSPFYTAPIPVGLDSRVTLRARAFRTDWTPSPEVGGSFVVTGTVATPSFDLPSGTYPSAQFVLITCATPRATIRYTVDGTVPTAASPLVTGPLELREDSNQTVRARAFLADWLDSPSRAATYRITGTVATPVASLPAGAYDAPIEVTFTSATRGATVRGTLDGTPPSSASPALPARLALAPGSDVLVRARAYRADWIDSAPLSVRYRVYSPLSIVDDAGLPLAAARVEAGADLAFQLRGGSGVFTTAVERDSADAAGSVTARGGGAFTFTAPAHGAFAGDHRVVLTDTLTGWTATLVVHVAPGVTVARPSLLGGTGRAAVVVTGGRPGSTFELTVLDPEGLHDADGSFAAVTPQVTASADPATGHAAAGELTAADVRTNVVVRVRAVQASLEGLSATTRVLAASARRGIVTNAVGAPVTDARVAAAHLLDDAGAPFQTNAGADGRFVLVLPTNDGTAPTLTATADGYLPAEVDGTACEGEPGCTIILHGEPRTVAGHVLGLVQGERVRLLARVGADALASDPLEIKANGSGRDAFTLELDRQLAWARLEVRAPGYLPLDDDRGGLGYALDGGELRDIDLTPTPTTPEAGPLALTSASRDTLVLVSSAKTNERAATARLERSSGDTWAAIGAPVELAASTEPASPVFTASGLTCGETYRVRATVKNDRGIEASGEPATFETAACEAVKSGCDCSTGPGNALPLAFVALALLQGRRRRA
jgi:uncharacterized protein (TIGR03382 family)